MGVTPEQTRAAVQRGLDEGAHVGALLHARHHGEVVADLAMGLARPGVEMTSGTLMPWFSCTKPITAVAVLQLWERGDVGLDDPVARFVPAFGSSGKHSVTIRHVLAHTAGLHKAEGDLDALCAAALAPDWIPGRRAAYDHRNAFLVLGEVVRVVDGRAYEAYVNEEVLEPLDMADTWVALPAERVAAYGDRMGVMHNTMNPSAPEPIAALANAAAYAKAHPSRSAIGPVGDLVTFFAALLNPGDGGVLSRPAVEAMTARHRSGLVDETFGQVIDWGLGVMVNSWHYRLRPASYGYGDHAGWRAFGHGGAESTLAFADPDNDLAVAIICNGMPGEARNHRRTQRIVNALYADLGIT
jgi:CubicO group peptidase (beta-lactamase class C family)